MTTESYVKLIDKHYFNMRQIARDSGVRTAQFKQKMMLLQKLKPEHGSKIYDVLFNYRLRIYNYLNHYITIDELFQTIPLYKACFGFHLFIEDGKIYVSKKAEKRIRTKLIEIVKNIEECLNAK